MFGFEKTEDNRVSSSGWRMKKANFPEGEIISMHSISDFCRKYGLRISAISELLNGKYKHHKGWKVFN